MHSDEFLQIFVLKNSNLSAKIETELENILACLSGAQMGFESYKIESRDTLTLYQLS